MCVTIGTCTTKSSEPAGLISFLFDIPVQRDGGLDQGQSRASHLRLGKQSVVELVLLRKQAGNAQATGKLQRNKDSNSGTPRLQHTQVKEIKQKKLIFISCFSSVFNMLFSYLIITVLPQACDGTDLELTIGPERQERENHGA